VIASGMAASVHGTVLLMTLSTCATCHLTDSRMTCGAATGGIPLTATRRMNQHTTLRSPPRRQVHSLVRRLVRGAVRLET
jgi:hypothetical protein